MKPVSARAPFSPAARALFANPETRREMVRQILSGADRLRVAGHTFQRRGERVMTDTDGGL